MTGNTRALLEPLAVWLDAQGFAKWTPSGIYAAGETGIFMKVMPPAPDRVVVLNAVWNDANPSLPLDQVMVQVRGRGLPANPIDVDDLLDPIFDVLHGRTNWDLGGGLVINQILRQVTTPFGTDELKRWERIDQYYLDLDVPPTSNRPTGGAW